jgi:hypothetical protein
MHDETQRHIILGLIQCLVLVMYKNKAHMLTTFESQHINKQIEGIMTRQQLSNHE